ncbi:MAG: hypothetical protein WDZ88_01985 [Candidatus Paceibacterota bacterium]
MNFYKKILFISILLGVIFAPLTPRFATDNAFVSLEQNSVYAAIGSVGTALSTGQLISSAGGKGWGVLTDSFSGALAEFQESLLKKIGSSILYLFAGITYIAGVFLEISIETTIVGMSSFVENSTAIDQGWTKFRDIANLFFIFTILFIAIATILQIDRYEARKLLARVVLAAILMNFSLLFTKALIDFSNVVSIQFYDSMTTVAGEGNESEESKGFAANIMSLSRVGTAYNITASDLSQGVTPQVAGENLGNLYKFLLATLGGAGFLLIIAFAFLVMSFALVARFLMLVMLMVLSPLMFLAWILPWTQKYAGMWWSELTKQLIFPPLFFGLMYVSITIMDDVVAQFNTGANLSSALTSGDVAALGGFTLNYALMIGFVLGSLIISLKVGAMGSKHSMSFAKKTTGFIGRNTAGATAHRLKEGDGFLARNLRRASQVPLVGTAISSTLDKASTASYGGKKGGYAGVVKEKQKGVASRLEYLGKGRDKQAAENRKAKELRPGRFDTPSYRDALNAQREVEEKKQKKQNAVEQQEQKFGKTLSRYRQEVRSDYPEKQKLDADIEVTEKKIAELEKEMLVTPSMRRSSDEIAAEMSVYNDKKRQAIKEKLELRKKAKRYRDKIREMGEKIQERKSKEDLNLGDELKGIKEKLDKDDDSSSSK